MYVLCNYIVPGSLSSGGTMLDQAAIEEAKKKQMLLENMEKWNQVHSEFRWCLKIIRYHKPYFRLPRSNLIELFQEQYEDEGHNFPLGQFPYYKQEEQISVGLGI